MRFTSFIGTDLISFHVIITCIGIQKAWVRCSFLCDDRMSLVCEPRSVVEFRKLKIIKIAAHGHKGRSENKSDPP